MTALQKDKSNPVFMQRLQDNREQLNSNCTKNSTNKSQKSF